MIIKCTMREGITEADIEGYRYTFRPDANGNPLCSVTKEGHVKEFLNMGRHCYVEWTPPIPVEQMSAKDILAAPEGVYEEQKAKIRQNIADGERLEIDAKARREKLMAEKEKADGPGKKEEDSPPAVTTSPAVALAEARIAEIINSFRTLTKKKFREWIEINRDLIPTMPEDVKAAIAKKILAKFPEEDPGITGLNLEKYASKDPADKGHSNIK